MLMNANALVGQEPLFVLEDGSALCFVASCSDVTLLLTPSYRQVRRDVLVGSGVQSAAQLRQVCCPLPKAAPNMLLTGLYCATCCMPRPFCRPQSGRVSATPRQLEAMIRMSEALARMHLRTEVSLWFLYQQ